MKHLFILSSLLFFYNLQAQTDSLERQDLESVVIIASKIKLPKFEMPISITQVNSHQKQGFRQQLSFNEYLTTVPGLFVQNAYNFSQDLRVSIRGFGARSAFGIRGVKLIVDGIPETTPDGQGQIDNLNLEAIENLEIIRGPSSLLYGNAAGGVISVQTLSYVDRNYYKASMTFGGFGMQKYQLGFGLKNKQTYYLFQSNLTSLDGYRDFSGFSSTNLNAKIKHYFSKKSNLVVNLNYTSSPYAKDAGSLNAQDLKLNRRQARVQNVNFDTQESVRQFKLGVALETSLSQTLNLKTFGFLSTRDFYTKLPFQNGGIVDLERFYYGHGSYINYETSSESLKNTLQMGYDLAFQSDERERFANEMGTQGSLSFDQIEKFNNYGIYLLDHFEIDDFLIRAGLRYDSNTLDVSDHFLNDGNDSDQLKLPSFNYSLGFNYKLTNQHALFANLSTSFETPVLSELSANPDGGGGFNNNLDAQTATNYEVGYRYRSVNTSIEAVAFYIDTEDDIVPYELQQFPDREFFRNAGATFRRGLELSMNQALIKHIDINLAYTFSDFKYGTYEVSGNSFRGNKLPAIPKHLFNAQVNYLSDTQWQAQLELTSVGKMFADDANATEINAYAVLNLRFRKSIDLNSFELTPFFGINNLLNETYSDNIRINAFGGRYYEAAPEIHVFGGLRVKI